MRHKDLTFNISKNKVRLKPRVDPSSFFAPWVLHIEGLTEETIVLRYPGSEMMSHDIEAFERLFGKLKQLQPEPWDNSKGVMSRGETKLMQLAVSFGLVSVLACLVYLLVQLFK